MKTIHLLLILILLSFNAFSQKSFGYNSKFEDKLTLNMPVSVSALGSVNDFNAPVINSNVSEGAVENFQIDYPENKYLIKNPEVNKAGFVLMGIGLGVALIGITVRPDSNDIHENSKRMVNYGSGIIAIGGVVFLTGLALTIK